MSKKSISINPNFFKIGKKSKKEKKSRKQRPVNSLKPNNVKKKLIEKIKQHQQREKEKEILQEETEERQFQDSFKDTLNYLQELDKKAKKKKKKKKRRDKTLKKNSIPINTVPMETPINFNATVDPPWGCLKNGTKPTFRQYNKTLKKKPIEKNQIPINSSNSFDNPTTDVIDTPVINLGSIKFEKNNDFDTRKDKLENLKKMMNKDKPKTKRIKTRRIRRKITLGKVKNKVGVLVKSKKTRKIIKEEVGVLKKKPIQEIKTYLKKHNLIKIGSPAPDYIFRTMYENAYLSGDISNKNDEILLHNWSKEIPV